MQNEPRRGLASSLAEGISTFEPRCRSAGIGQRPVAAFLRLSRLRDWGSGGEGRLRLLASFCLLLIVALAAADTVEPQTSAAAPSVRESGRTLESEEVAHRAIGELRSPYCPGLMLEVCPSGPAEQLRDSIHMLAAAGMSSEALVEWMIANHGEEWRAVPKRRGLGLWAWILPPFALLLGAGVLALRLRTLRGSAHVRQRVDSDDTWSDEDRAQLDAALADFEASQEEPV